MMGRQSIEIAYRTRLTAAMHLGMRATVAVAVAVYAYQGKWSIAIATVVVLALMLAPNVLQRRYGLYLPFALDFGIVMLIFFSLFIGSIQNYYDYLPIWDKILHFQSGLILAVAGFVVVYILNQTERMGIDLTPFFVAIFAASFSIALGALWEIGEFTGDSFLHMSAQGGLFDTMWDLIADAVGAIVVSAIGYVWMRYESRIPFTPRFLRAVEEEKRVGLVLDHETERGAT